MNKSSVIFSPGNPRAARFVKLLAALLIGGGTGLIIYFRFFYETTIPLITGHRFFVMKKVDNQLIGMFTGGSLMAIGLIIIAVECSRRFRQGKTGGAPPES